MNIIDLHIDPRKSISWEEFVKTTPSNSIALDGYVSAPPQYDPNTKHLNLDHHHGVFRQSMMSTAQQVMMAIKGGLFTSFREKQNDIERPVAHVYVNDCDQDVALALFILENYKMFEGTKSIPQFNRLLEIDGKMDVTAGAYPFALDESLMMQHEWIFDPYSKLRASGKLSDATSQMMFDNIEAVMARIMQFLLGNAKEKEILASFAFLGHPKHNFEGLDETEYGLHSRYYRFSQGMKAYVSLVSYGTGSNTYTIGRSGVFIPFNVSYLLETLDRLESLDWREIQRAHMTSDKFIEIEETLKATIPSLVSIMRLPQKFVWGGSDLVGGSRQSTIPSNWIVDVVDYLLDLEPKP